MSEIRKIYVAAFLQGFGTIASVTYTLFFLSNNLTQTQIGILFSFFMINLAVMEIPTGAFSDTLGHKTSVTVGTFIFSISFLIFFLSNNFAGFMAGMFFASLGLAFQSGAISSLIHDILKKIQKLDHFEKVQGKLSAIFLLAGIVSAPLGTVLYEHFQRLPYLIAFIASFLSALMFYKVRWEFHQKDRVTIKTYIHKIQKGVLLTISNRKLLSFVVITIALTTSRLVVNQNISQPYLLKVGLSISLIGVVVAMISGVSALINVYSHKISQKIGDFNSLVLMIVGPGLCAVILSFLYTPFAVLFLVLHHTGYAYKEPVLARLSQKELNDNNRATMASTGSFLSSIIVGLLLPFWGNIIDFAGLHTTLLYLGIYTLVVGTFAISVYQNSNRTL